MVEGAWRSTVRCPEQAHTRSAAVLFVIDAQFVDASVQRDRSHAGRPRAPDYQPVIDPDIESVVRPAVDVNPLWLGKIPIANPPGPEESPRKFGIVLEKIECRRSCDIVKKQRSIVARTLG